MGAGLCPVDDWQRRSEQWYGCANMAQRPDVIVVLGCRTEASGRITATARRRASRAAEAYREGVASWVLVTGGRLWGPVSEAAALRSELVGLGVPPDAIVCESAARCTWQNARYSARLMRSRGMTTPAIVTCAWHMQRALGDFRAAGLDPLPLPADGPTAGPITRAHRRLSERLRGWIDAAAMRVAELR